jgi:uncharacterized protein
MDVSNGILQAMISGACLAALSLGHFFVTRTQLTGSGRITKLVDRWRFGPPPPELSDAELLEAFRQVSHGDLGSQPDVAIASISRVDRAAHDGKTLRETLLGPRLSPTASCHVAFLVGIIGGARLSSPASPVTWSLGEPVLREWVAPASLPWVMLVGGVLVGFGTRMAGGCTMGHGLCGLSRLQPGSLVSTLAFFGTGIVVALLLS